MFAFQPTDRVFGHTTYVFALPAYGSFAVLQSRVHEPWARLLSSSMKTDLRYSPSDCFETFPFPKADPRTVLPELESVGQALYDVRAKYMVDEKQGLTKTYNAIKDPASAVPRIFELRRLHEAMDRAVLDAYGWTDIVVPPYCPLNDADRRAVQAFEDEVIDRLYVLNAERAREEARLGLSSKKTKRTASSEDEGNDANPAPLKKSGKKSASGSKVSKDQRKLF